MITRVWLGRVAGLAVASAVGVAAVRSALAVGYLGEDLWPLVGAGRAVLGGTDVYTVHNFVYPPSAAVVSVPLSWVPLDTVVRATVVLQVITLGVLAAVSVLVLVPPPLVPARSPWRPLLAGLAAAAVLGGVTTYRSLPLVNVSVFLAPVVLALAVLWGRGSWGRGSALLAASLLVKPLLAPLLLVPLLARRPRPVAAALAACAAVTALCLPLAGGPTPLLDVARKLASGGILVGQWSRNNLSIAGFATMHPLPPHTALLARTAVVLLALAACAVVLLRQRTWDAPRVAWLSALLLGAVFLASRLAEVHYLAALVPGAVAILLRSGSRPARVLAGVGAALLFLPYWHVTLLRQQELSLAGQALIFVAAVLATVHAALRDAEPAGAAPEEIVLPDELRLPVRQEPQRA